MTTEEFRIKAREVGLSDKLIAMQIDLQNKLRLEGLPTISYEDILRAKQHKSCITVFEEHASA